MPRVLLSSLLALLLLVPATADGSSGVRLRGTVTAKTPSAHLVAVKASRQLFSLRVPGTLAAIRAGLRVELRGSTLRARSGGSRVLATGVTVASSRPLQTTSASDDDEREIKGTLTSLSPPTVTSGAQSVSCIAPAGMSLSGLAVGDLVEMTCDLVGGAWVARKIHLEDEAAAAATKVDDDDDDRGHSDDDDHGDHGSGDADHGDDD